MALPPFLLGVRFLEYIRHSSDDCKQSFIAPYTMPVGTNTCKETAKVNGDDESSNSDGESSSCEFLAGIL